MIINDPSKCTGCMLCKEICPNDAIGQRTDSLGFIYPQRKTEKCNGCRLCEKECSNLPALKQKSKQNYYAVINKDQETVAGSASGGVFPALAKEIIHQHGTVFGAGYDQSFAIKHFSIHDASDIPKLQGTKYPQSSMIGLYEEIKTSLLEGREVLFVGTPCQCAAIKEYIKNSKTEDGNLYIADLFCNGVISPKIWGEYIEFIEKRFGKTEQISFRDKKKGWRNKHMKVYAGGEDISDYCNNKASILRIYEMEICFRASCYQCPYKSMERVGDISIGDFWGIERVKLKLDRNTGVSALITNNDKGERLFERTKESFDYFSVKKEEILQPVLKGFTPIHPERENFIHSYEEGQTEMILERYGKVKGFVKLKRDYIVPLLYTFQLAGIASKILHRNDD